jgi:hypothetical protein
MAGLLASPLFRSVVAGAGFFADSYDLFVTDGVGNVLKGLGPAQQARFSAVVTPACSPASAIAAFGAAYNASNAGATQTVTGSAGYATFVCFSGGGGAGSSCLAKVWADAPTCALVDNPGFDAEVVPLYQLQTTYLKNGLNNAASFGNVFGQLLFGVLGDLLGRRANFVLTSLLIIVGCLGAATAAGGTPLAGAKTPWGLWASTSAAPPLGSPTNDVYGQLFFWRALLGLGVGGEYPLASTITSESSTSAARGAAVLSIFSMQGFGKLTAAIVNFACISTLKYYGGSWTARPRTASARPSASAAPSSAPWACCPCGTASARTSSTRRARPTARRPAARARRSRRARTAASSRSCGSARPSRSPAMS